MSPLSAIAIFFIIWWTILFTTLPIGVRSQAEDGEVIDGSEAGAPTRANLRFKLMLTTVISLLLFGLFYYLTVIAGFSFDDIPQVLPSPEALSAR